MNYEGLTIVLGMIVISAPFLFYWLKGLKHNKSSIAESSKGDGGASS